jgi:hypothetical protein
MVSGHTRSAEDEEALMKEWAAMSDAMSDDVGWEGNLPLNQDEVDSVLGFDIRKKHQEPSMEEILASIRRIMAEAADNPEPVDQPKKDTPYVTNWKNVTTLINEGMPADAPKEKPRCPTCKSDKVLCQCEIDSLLGFDDPPEKNLRELLIDMRTNKKLRSEGMPFWSFLSDMAMGMTAFRDSWPKNWKHVGLWMNDENRLILNGEEWVPTQDDILADDWQIGD